MPVAVFFFFGFLHTAYGRFAAMAYIGRNQLMRLPYIISYLYTICPLEIKTKTKREQRHEPGIYSPRGRPHSSSPVPNTFR
jgi:hypothetical protein